MKLLALQGQTPRSESLPNGRLLQPAAPACHGTPPSSSTTIPPELWINMTITRMEHIEALMETLQTFAPQLETARRREDD